MNKTFSILGHDINIAPTDEYQGTVTKKTILTGIDILQKYKAGKQRLEEKIVKNEKWFKMQHWDLINNKDTTLPEPVTGYLFNTIANKHADAMDNYPEPNILEREQSDLQEAEMLSEIIPLVVEKNKFRQTYSSAWWYKLKQGFSVYGIFWDKELENGLGDISIKKLDALNVFWEPGITDIQDSRNLFVVSLVDNDIIEETWPHTKGKLADNKAIDVKLYVTDDSIDTSEKSVVVDWYKKVNTNGKSILHMTKFVGQIPLYSTEDDEIYREIGLYEHGMYPIVFDVLYPEEGLPTGFGYIDIVKNPQMYIDKLDQIISKNALVSGKQRWLIKDSGNINEKELMDFSIDVVHCSGNIGEENVRPIQATPLHPFIVQHRQNKIGELKETAGANDFNRGESGGGITAASAIMALQEAGNKLSRDMIQESYSCYVSIIYMCIELIRQFYDEPRKFRIVGNNQTNYVAYSNQNLKEQQLPALYKGEEAKFRKPIFDIKVKPEKTSPFSKAAHNEIAKEMFNMGFFNPQRATEALVALEMMSFEGKDKIVQIVSQNSSLMEQMAQMKATMDKMATVIQHVTGRDLGGGENSPGGNPQMQEGVQIT